MKKRLGGLLLLAALGGCVESQPGSFMSNASPMGGSSAPQCGPGGCTNGAPYQGRPVPGIMGALGEPISVAPGAMPNPGMSMPYATSKGNDAENAARQSFAASLPPQIAGKVLFPADARRGRGLLASGLDANGLEQGGMNRSGILTPMDGGVIQVGGPGGPSTVPGPVPPVGSGFPGAVAAVGALKDGAGPFSSQRTSLRFAGPNGMKVSWYVPGEDGRPQLAPVSLEVPGRYNFPQANIYRLKLSNIPGRPGLELYPTLEVVPANGKTSTFLAHSSVPLVFTQEDFDQVASGNYLVKVVYLPNPNFQDLALSGPNEIVSSRLEPGADPIAEALARGSILLVIRMGNIDLEAPNTPAIDAPSPYQPKVPPMGPPLGMGGPGMGGPGMMMLPPGMGGPGMGGPGMGGPGMAGGPGMIPPGVGGPGMGGPGMMPPGMGGMMPPQGMAGMMPQPGTMGNRPGMLPQGGPMMPGMFPPPGMMGPQGPGAGAGPTMTPGGPTGPVGMKSVEAATQPGLGGEEASERPAKKSNWLSSFFGGKSKG